MAEFLTDAWVAELDAAASDVEVPSDVRLVVQQVVEDDDGREAAYAVRIGDGRVSVTPGRAEDADVTFTQDRETAVAIARGELGAQVAFMAGRLRVGGDLRDVMTSTRNVLDLDDLFAGARATTVW